MNDPGVRPPAITLVPPYQTTPAMPNEASTSIIGVVKALMRPAFM